MKEIESIEGVFAVEDMVEYADGSIVSKQLLQNAAGNITLFSFDKGQRLSEHTAPYDAVCQILDGTAEITIAGSAHAVSRGEMIIMPANVPHALCATTKFKMLLTMIKGN